MFIKTQQLFLSYRLDEVRINGTLHATAEHVETCPNYYTISLYQSVSETVSMLAWSMKLFLAAGLSIGGKKMGWLKDKKNSQFHFKYTGAIKETGKYIILNVIWVT